MRIRTIVATVILLLCAQFTMAQLTPKREFRGVWMHTVGTNDFYKRTPQEARAWLRNRLDSLQKAGINAVLFQIRPEADAFYPSRLEPWSRFLTGVQGQAPSPVWDPLAFMIDECHKRGMEFHAWVNPYRVQTNINVKLSPGHIYYSHPEWFVVYGNQRYFDPGLPESRKFINLVMADIVKRYDVDAIHMDDYFYPYPIPGKEFPDDASFARYGVPYGFAGRKDDWRRNNVNLLIKELHQTIRDTKPWVKFGVSPFGIYRNKKNTPDGSGSETNGLQNYDDLYADVIYWAKKGWIDYNIPQVYWEIGHKAADYETLINWWSANAAGIPLFIGQDVVRTAKFPDLKDSRMNQLPRKMYLSRTLPSIQGNCFWSCNALMTNPGNYMEALTKVYQRNPALPPVFTHMDDKAPKPVAKLKKKWTSEGYKLTWNSPKYKTEMDRAVTYCIYKFDRKEKVDLDNPSKIVAVTRDSSYIMPYELGKKKFRYVVTALDRLQNESKAKKTKVKL